MAYKLVFEKEAADELDQIIGYITVQLDNRPAAQALFDEIVQTLDNIKAYPESAPLSKYASLRDNDIRQLTVKNFALFYYIDKQAGNVIILRVKYAKSDLSALLIRH